MFLTYLSHLFNASGTYTKDDSMMLLTRCLGSYCIKFFFFSIKVPVTGNQGWKGYSFLPH